MIADRRSVRLHTPDNVPAAELQARSNAGRRPAFRGAPGMTSDQEVKVQTRGPTEGTRHRRDKGVDLEHQVLRRGQQPEEPARGCLVEVIGAWLDRAQAKRRKASASGKPAPGGEVRYPYETRVYWRRGSHEERWSYPGRSAGLRASGSPENERTEDDGPAEVRWSRITARSAKAGPKPTTTRSEAEGRRPRSSNRRADWNAPRDSRRGWATAHPPIADRSVADHGLACRRCRSRGT